MEKTITLSMYPSKDIGIGLNGCEVLVISHDNRTITADSIFELLAYTRGDKYTVECINEKGVDIPVLSFFFNLMKDIVDRLNRLDFSDENTDERIIDDGTEKNDFIEDTGIEIEDDDLPF